jgi:hypothetical protein
LKKALYGLKQASLAWNKAANESLEQLGFKRLISDAGIYTIQNDRTIIIFISYVDDVLFMENDYKLLMDKMLFRKNGNVEILDQSLNISESKFNEIGKIKH